MNQGTQSSSATRIDTTLLVLGLASFVLYPFTAIPGIVIAKRHGNLSLQGRAGYILCWVAMGLFCVHLSLVGAMIYHGMKP
jgi:hypothetical protein